VLWEICKEGVFIETELRKFRDWKERDSFVLGGERMRRGAHLKDKRRRMGGVSQQLHSR